MVISPYILFDPMIFFLFSTLYYESLRRFLIWIYLSLWFTFSIPMRKMLCFYLVFDRWCLDTSLDLLPLIMQFNSPIVGPLSTSLADVIISFLYIAQSMFFNLLHSLGHPPRWVVKCIFDPLLVTCTYNIHLQFLMVFVNLSTYSSWSFLFTSIIDCMLSFLI